MVFRRPRTVCQCPRSIPLFSSALLFLSIVLPASSYAQITDPAFSITSSSPITFQTSNSSSASPSTSSRPPASTANPNPNSSTPPTDPDQIQEHVFNYYFLIIAVVAVLFCMVILYFSRRKKLKTALLRSQSQRALATDVAGFRARFGNRTDRTNGSSYGGGRPRLDRVEGLDARGEAPPPYIPGNKPPSFDGVPASATAAAVEEEVELGDMSRPQPAHHPPEYHEHVETSRSVDYNLRRPGEGTAADGSSESTMIPGRSTNV